MDDYNLSYSGQQVNTAIGKVLNPDTTAIEDSNNLITSGGVKTYVDGKSLPSVTASDNGKVLMVINGIWTQASLPTYDGSVS